MFRGRSTVTKPKEARQMKITAPSKNRNVDKNTLNCTIEPKWMTPGKTKETSRCRAKISMKTQPKNIRIDTSAS